MSLVTAKSLGQYQDQGYLIIREAFAPERVEALQLAVGAMIDRALAGACELNWIDCDERLPARTEHFFHPAKYQSAWAAWLAEDLVDSIDALVDGLARHSLFGMLASGGGQAYCQGWHRDLGRPGAPDEAELLRRFHGDFVQFNAPLVRGDRFLQIVPASHLRVSSQGELEAAAKGTEGAEMPGALTVELEPGDIVFYDANLWHRGWNPTGEKRWTMHCAFWKEEYPVMAHEYGQREALETEGHIEQMPAKAAEYLRRYLARYPAGDPPTLFEL